MDSPLLLTTKQVQKELNRGKTHVFEIIKSGELPSIKDGRCRRIHRRDLEAYAERLRQGGAAA